MKRQITAYNHMANIGIFLIFQLVILVCGLHGARADMYAGMDSSEKSLFMEDEKKVITIATGKRESAFEAPAIADSINVFDIKAKADPGFKTILNYIPGFYLEQSDEKTQPYFRGTPDSILWLYGSVPMSSGISRKVASFDAPLLLSGIKRVEVVRGPASILWGPDAFAGVVNVVPITGSDFQGVETGACASSFQQGLGTYLNIGTIQSDWDLFTNVAVASRDKNRTYNVSSFYENGSGPSSLSDRFAVNESDRYNSISVTTNMTWNNSADLLVRFEDLSDIAVQSNPDNTLAWQEKNNATKYIVAGNVKKDLGDNRLLRIKSYINHAAYEDEVIDFTFSHDETTLFGESLIEQALFSGQGSLVAGGSVRYRDINDIPVWDTYLPDYLGSSNTSFLPSVSKLSLTSTLASLFLRYYHTFDAYDIWGGARFDASNAFEDQVSCSIGGLRRFENDQMLKLVLGTAYRTPVGLWYVKDVDQEPEQIETVSIQYSWNPKKNLKFSATGYLSEIRNRRTEDLYMGVSEPDEFTTKGMELDLLLPLTDQLEIGANASFFSATGSEDTFNYADYLILNPNGTITPHYTQVSRQMIQGPDISYRLYFHYTPVKSLYFSGSMEYISSFDAQFLNSTQSIKMGSDILFNVGMEKTDIFMKGLDLIFSIENLTDKDFQVPGKYGPIDGRSLEVSMLFKLKW